jgi:hypothetical protein
MSSAGERPFLHTFCGRLDKKYGVWRDATRRLFIPQNTSKVADPDRQSVGDATKPFRKGYPSRPGVLMRFNDLCYDPPDYSLIQVLIKKSGMECFN